ncbi:MAG: S49 family peptidase [Acidimicrobiales bacterium]
MPFTGLVARESVGRAIGKTVAIVLTAVTTLSLGFLAMLLVMVAVLANLAATPTDTTGLAQTFVTGDEGNPRTVLAIPVTGVILGENEGGGLFASLVDATYGYDVKAELEAAAADPGIRAVVLEMDTPGGTIFGSRAIADAVSAYQASTGRPVVTFVRGMSASGGMYAMAGADHIVADHGTLIGSIGVIFGPFAHYKDVVAMDGGLLGSGVETTGGITEEYITAGRSKDLGNPFREFTAEERKVLQTGVDNNYGQFVAHVAAGRELTEDAVRGDLGALIFDEQSALANGLIDEVGNRDMAYAKAAERAGLDTGNYQVTRVDRSGGGLFGLGAMARSLTGTEPDPESTATATAPGSAPTAGVVPARHPLCANGPTMLAWFGDLPAGCRG